MFGQYKKCVCKICEKNGGSPLFSSVIEGKIHVFNFHKIHPSKAREYLTPATKDEYVVKKMWEE